MVDLSEQAQMMCAGWFSFGEKATVRSHPPHENITRHKAALDELIAAGIVTGPVKFNNAGVVEYKGSTRAMEIAHELMLARSLHSKGREDNG